MSGPTIRGLANIIQKRMSLTFRRKQKCQKMSCDKYHSREFLETDLLFKSFLKDKYGRELFMNFLISEFSEENLEFWNACEEFSNMDMEDTEVKDVAQLIYSNYVKCGSLKEVNINSETRKDIEDKIDSPTKNIFAAAQKRVQSLMEKDTFYRFAEKQLCLQVKCPYFTKIDCREPH